VLRAFRKAHRASLADDALLAQFRLSDWERDLAHVDPGFRDASPVSRLDAFFVAEAGGLRFTEYNAETPAGGAYNDVLTEVFFGLPIMREFMRSWDLRPLPARHDVLHALLDAYAQWSGTRSLPRIAIVDWSDVPTRSEFLLFQDYFARQGLDCVIVDPRTVEYDGKRLRSEHGDIDLVYKRVLLTELVEREGLDHPILRAVKDHKVCMVNPPSCKILHKKASLAVLHDERNAELFDAGEREAITASIPWTRVVEDRRTTFEGVDIDLLAFAEANREMLVLKPNDEYGGKGVTLGWETEQGAWDTTLDLAQKGSFVVQERIVPTTEVFPAMAWGLENETLIVDCDPYMYFGKMYGCLSRLTAGSLANVTSGGGQVPTFVVPDEIA